MKKLKLSICIVITFILLCGCAVSNMVVFEVNTGDALNVSMQPKSGYEITAVVDGFKIHCMDSDVSMDCSFLDKESFEKFEEMLQEYDHSKGSIGELTFILYKFDFQDEVQNNVVMWIGNYNTGIFMEGTNSKEETLSILENLIVSVEPASVESAATN